MTPLLGLALLFSLSACNNDPPVDDGCKTLCACRVNLPSDRASCELECQGSVIRDHVPSAGCLQCAADSVYDSCLELERRCSFVCTGPEEPGDDDSTLP